TRRSVGSSAFGIVPLERVGNQGLETATTVRAGSELERTNAQVAGSDARQHGAGQRSIAIHHFAGCHGCEGARRGDTQMVHSLAHDVLAEDWTDAGFAVPPSRERRRTRAFEVNVATAPVAIDDLAQQQRAPISQLR